MASSAPTGESDAESGMQSTVVALFEDAIDAEHALLALRKANQAANRVSLLVRSQTDDRNGADRAVDVARDIVAVALGAVASWLSGLAELIVSEQGRYLVAGPMGAALTGIVRGSATEDAATGRSYLVTTDLNADSLLWVLTEFGFAATEAEYVEHRLTAGATLVAMTSAEAAELETARRVFGDHDAVYIGAAATATDVLGSTGTRLAAGLDLADNGQVAVVDAIVPIRPAVEDEDPYEVLQLRGRTILGADGSDAGLVDRVLIEDAAVAAMSSTTPRYLIIAFGGMLGIGRRKVAIPIELADLATDPLTLRVDKATLHRAPPYDEDAPLSRSVEERLARYFNVSPYWLAADAAGPATTAGGGDGSDRERDRGG